MVAINYSGRLSAPLGPVTAGLAAAAVSLSVAAMPAAWLDPLVAGSGLPALFAAAAPPVGVTGRTLLALGAGAIVALAGYIMLSRHARPVDATPDAPVLRRADAHPDAPSRRPIRASEDLGPPLPIAVPPPAPQNHEQPLPADLDLPLAAFDPAALPVTPAEPVRPVAPLATRRALIDPGERFETFHLTPVTRTPRSTASEPVSIGALLDRLERSTQRAPRRRVDVDQTLGMLRGLATG
ncbi:hypothetical protein M0208_15835 [Sphingomonas sp. SUN019]|uniref:hypothetical protein n=1 Tax=Sphingomonas sp. SUN019 TaxID=2937788 RepID=UPI002164269C|nr:hypothetical protein [Sphingomonas sp. SUN019]UVO51909.1 hypothetical protein M0208_15835 [Sphingomonas sp. SUN019]